MHDQYTVITCSYNTPIVTECLLRSYYKYHPNTKHNIIIIDNSTDNLTASKLDSYNIPYVRGKDVLPKAPNDDNWWYHPAGLDWAIKQCTTPYCLIVDTDIIFCKNISLYLRIFSSNDEFVAMGEHISGGQAQRIKDGKVVNVNDNYILPRIHPCFMLLDVNFFNKHNLTFNQPNNINLPDNHIYDAGSYLLQKIYELGKKTIRIEPTDSSYVHCGGLSWVEGVENKLDIYTNTVVPDLANVNITDKYFSDISVY